MQDMYSCTSDTQIIKDNVKCDSNEIAVSIYCLAYNHKKYIRDALEGFVNQKTTFRFEAIVHDDASTDGTQEVIREYAEKYPNIIKPVFQKENQYSQGVDIIDNFILPKMRGKYVAICEGDDYWTDPEKLQLQYEAMENHPECTICSHYTRWIDAENGSTGGFFPSRKFPLHEGIVDKSTQMNVAVNDLFHLTSVFLRRPFFDRLCTDCPEYANIMPVGDIALQLYFAKFGYMFFIDREMATYRRGTAGSWTMRVMRNPEKQVLHYEQVKDAFVACKEFFDEEYQDLFDKRILVLDILLDQLRKDKKAIRSRVCDVYNCGGVKMLIKVYFVGTNPTLQMLWDKARTQWEKRAR